MDEVTPKMRMKPEARRARPTLLDVARHLGLSKATISKVLNMPPEQCPVAQTTRQRVLEAVAELGYRPSFQARALANRRTQMVAIAYEAPLGAVPRGVYWDIVDRLDELLGQAGLCPTFVHTHGRHRNAADMLGDQRFDACLSLGTLPPRVLEVLRAEQLPTVLINAEADASWTCVNVNDVGGAELVMKHLLALGHKRIAYNAGRYANTHPSAIDRATTYTRMMHEAGLEPDKPFIGPVDEFVERCINGPYKPTAILDFEHWTAVIVLQRLWRRGVRVPDDVSVATFNDVYPVTLTIPPLTTVRLPSEGIAKHAAEQLIARIADPLLPPEHIVLDETLIIRESTAPPKS